MSQFFASGSQSIGVSASAISPSNVYSGPISLRMDWLDLLVVQETLESSPAPQFKSINSLALSFLYGPTLTSIHDHWNLLHCRQILYQLSYQGSPQDDSETHKLCYPLMAGAESIDGPAVPDLELVTGNGDRSCAVCRGGPRKIS